METILHTWGEEQSEKEQDEVTKLNPEREKFSVPHASKDPKILKDINLENEDIFKLIKKPPEVGVVRIFEKPEFWDTTIGLTHAVTTQGIATIQLPSGPLSIDEAQWHLLKHTLTNASPNSLGSGLQKSKSTLWCVTTDRWLRTTSTPSSKSLIYKKEKKTSSSPIM